MKKNIFKKQTIFSVEYNDLNKFIEEKYGHYCNVQEILEASKDSIHSFQVTGTVNPWHKAMLDLFSKTGKTWTEDNLVFSSISVDALLNDLCSKGIIEPGEYQINVCW